MRLQNMGKLGLAATFLFTTFTSLPAFSAEENAVMLEEVIVTARKVEESAQSVPVAITAITTELQRSSVRNLTDLNGYAPNVIISRDGGRSNGANINIRGISPTRSDDNSFDAPIAVMIDGVHLGSNAGQIMENFDLERVEVLRGPQGTLFGKNTVGGVINVIRSRPTGELGGKVKVTAGEDGQAEFRGVLNVGLIDDTLAAKVFYTHLESDGYMKNTTTGDDGPAKDYDNFGVTFLWTPSDSFELSFTAESYNDESDLAAYQTNYNLAPGVADAPLDSREKNLALGSLNCTFYPETCRTSLDIPKTSENDTRNAADLEVGAYTLNMTFDINENLTLKSVTGWRDMDEWRIYDFDGSSAPFITIERKNDYRQFSQELRLEGTWDRASIITGLYYWNSEFTQDWVTGGTFWSFLSDIPYGGAIRTEEGYAACLAGQLGALTCDPTLTSIPGSFFAGDVVTQVLYETQETSSIAAFVQGEYDVTDDLSVSAGLRWTREEKNFVAGQAYLSDVASQWDRNFNNKYAVLDNIWNEVSPMLGATYRLNEDAMVHVRYSEGFHSGGFFGVNQNIKDFERDQYQPEYAETIEIGYKSMWMNNRLRANVTLFQNEFDDKQESFVKLDPSTSTVATVFENAASVTYQGVELELELAVTEGLRVFLNYGYLDAEYDEFDLDISPTDNVDNVVDATFLTPRNAPEYTLGYGFTFTQQIGPGDFEIFVKMTEQGEQETDVLNLSAGRLASGAQDDLSATIGYHTERWSATIFGTNLTDERSEIPIVLGGSNTGAALFIVGNVNAPRHYGAEFTYNF